MEQNSNTLSKNHISSFILKIDLSKDDIIDFHKIANAISKSYHRIETRKQSGFQFNLQEKTAAIDKVESIDYVLSLDSPQIEIVFSINQNSIIFTSSQYRDNKIYKDRIQEIIDLIKLEYTELNANRIGMRFINEYNCNELKKVNNIFNKNISNNIKAMADKEFISRVISQEEYNFSDSKLRLQYGIPNRFYPGLLNNYDLILDIDSYVDSRIIISEWASTLSNLNHNAYRIFKESMNLNLIESLK